MAAPLMSWFACYDPTITCIPACMLMNKATRPETHALRAQSNAPSGGAAASPAIPGSGASAGGAASAVTASADAPANPIQPAAPGYTRGSGAAGERPRGIFGIFGIAAETTVTRPVGGNTAPVAPAGAPSTLKP